MEVSGKSLGSLWEVSGKSLGSLWEISGRSLGGLWEVSGRFLGGLWEVSGRSLGGLLGRRVSRRFQKVLDSKSDAALSENVKKFPRGLTLPCVFEGQNHFMLQICVQNAFRQRKTHGKVIDFCDFWAF